MAAHNTSAGLMRVGGRPVYFVYDSYRLPADEWARLLGKDGNISVRGTELDGGLMQ
jgi:glycoprotein endo-alpha-1,2-mannosidase